MSLPLGVSIGLDEAALCVNHPKPRIFNLSELRCPACGSENSWCLLERAPLAEKETGPGVTRAPESEVECATPTSQA